MPAFQRLLQHLGFVKLRRYGLSLTSDGRIVSTRSAVLDDGTGAKVVGWQDGDVSIWKLSAWNEAGEVIPLVPARPVIPAASPVAPAPASPPSAPVIRAAVAAEPQVDEDDWEWTIALARARVAVDEAEVARPPEPVRRAAPPVMPEPPPMVAECPRTPTPPPPLVRPLVHPALVLPPPDWAANGSTTGEYEDYRVSATRPAIEIPHVPPAPIARGSTPSTVIPVPPLPLVDAALCSRLEPVVRGPHSGTTTARLAKGTAPVDPPAREAAAIVEDTIPNLSIGDRTKPGMAPPRRASAVEVAANGDRTKPGIALPAAARAVELPSIKRRSGSPPR